MNLIATALVTNEYNQLLLRARSKARDWAAPGGAVEVGELPSDAAAKAVEEVTGLKVLPVRLAAATFSSNEERSGSIHLVFRCLQKGGELIIPDDGKPLPAGFFYATKLPQPMAADTQKRIEMALYQVGPARWESRGSFLKTTLGRLLRRNEKSQHPDWTIDSVFIVGDPDGGIAVNKKNGLPVSRCLPGQAPWAVAQRLAEVTWGRVIEPNHLTAIFVHPHHPHAVFVFYAAVSASELSATFLPAGEINLPPDSPPAELLTADHEITHIGFWKNHP